MLLDDMMPKFDVMKSLKAKTEKKAPSGPLFDSVVQAMRDIMPAQDSKKDIPKKDVDVGLKPGELDVVAAFQGTPAERGKITVTVNGLPGSGKSSIACLVAACLKSHGIDVQLIDDTMPIDADVLKTRTKSIAENSKVVVKTQELRRLRGQNTHAVIYDDAAFFGSVFGSDDVATPVAPKKPIDADLDADPLGF